MPSTAHRLIAFAAAALILGATSAAVSTQGRRGSMMPRGYDPKAEVTVTVVVSEVKTMDAPMRGGMAMGTGEAMSGIHLVARSGEATVEIALGPASFFSSHEFAVMPEDELIVTGSRMTMDDHEMIVAREVRKGERTLALRDATGRPLWAGRGGGR